MREDRMHQLFLGRLEVHGNDETLNEFRHFRPDHVRAEQLARLCIEDRLDEAIGLAQKGGLDVILMDIMMPEMDGLQTMKEIRKIPACKDLPIIAVTAKAMKGDRERCIEAGAWDYLSKPVDREQLIGVLKAWLQR